MKVILYPAITLDGFIAKSDGDSDWVSGADDALYQQAIKEAGCAIVGRTTYEQYKSDFDEEGRVTFVCTSKCLKSTNENIIFVSGEPEEILQVVKDHGFDSVILSGGGETNARFARAKCIDEIVVSIYPFVMGDGIGLFSDSKNIELKLELISTKKVVDGIIQNHYKVIKD